MSREQVDTLIAIADELEQLSEENVAGSHKARRAADYIGRAIEVGAFNDPKWYAFRVDMEHYFNSGSPFVQAIAWMKKNGAKMGLDLDGSSEHGDLNYWCLFFSRLIQDQADEMENDMQAKAIVALSYPINWWERLNSWWKHNLWATVFVIVILSLPTIRGVVALVNDFRNMISGE